MSIKPEEAQLTCAKRTQPLSSGTERFENGRHIHFDTGEQLQRYLTSTYAKGDSQSGHSHRYVLPLPSLEGDGVEVRCCSTVHTPWV